MTERTLFPDDDPDKVPPKTPHNNTPTSRIAAQQAKTFVASQQEQVFAFIEQAGEHGATDQEIEAGLGLAGNSVRPRRSRLVQLRRVRDSGLVRRTQAGRAAVVWVVGETDAESVVSPAAYWPTQTNLAFSQRSVTTAK